jgi:hypothetical protein
MRHIKKIATRPILIILGICLFGILFLIYGKDIYKPPQILQVDNSRRTVIQVYPNAEGTEWLGTKWTDDGKYIQIYNSRGQVYANKLMMIDPENARDINNAQKLEKNNILGLVNALPFTLENREALWAGCQNENLFFTAKYLDNKDGSWETRLWKGSQLIKTFQPIRFDFGLYQSGFNDDPVGWIIEYSHFSPDCRYDIISYGKDVWLLDTVEKSFSRIFTVWQSIWPSWAPNSQEFVFTDNRGLQKYNVQSKKQSWLPSIASDVIYWSKTGKWILGYSEVISSDGSKKGVLEDYCANIGDPSGPAKDIDFSDETPSWSPTDDKFAFICDLYDRSTQKRESFLIIWDLSNLDGN